MLDKKLFPIIVGESLEAYDFFLYGLLSVFIAKTFFPQHSAELTLTYSFTLFSVAYVARPIGSIIWGHIADKYGRKIVLMGTLSLMAVPAIGMAFMPSYESIGVTATVLVVLCRFIQGIAFGGEGPTIAVTLYETAPENRKGFYGSFYNPGMLFGYLVGIILMIIFTHILGDSSMQSFGWRIMFGLSLLFIAVLSYIRLRLIETSRNKTQTLKFPILQTIKCDLPAILKIFFYFSCCTILFWNLLFHNYLIIWAKDFGVQSLLLQALVVAFVIILMPFIGHLSDKINKIKLLKISYVCIALTAPLLYMMFLSKNLPYMILSYLVLAVFTAITCATYPAVAIPQVSKNCRVSSLGIASSFSVMFGSFVPAINEITKISTGVNMSPAFLISFAALISLLALCTMKNKNI